MENTDTFHILALDGGGTRGMYTAQLLAKIEEAFGTRIKTHFGLIAGTSTGAIIAGAAVSDIPMTDIVELFETETPHIFRKRGIVSHYFPVNIRTHNSHRSLPNIFRQRLSAK